ncbi:MAG: YciI family protein [Chthoniobacterales bacterium]|nr:YciI family protein [Chthoniobacterales bacterium]
MFLILLTYKKTIEEIEKHLVAHRAFLDEGYKNRHFLFSGPFHPRTGGVITSPLKDREQLEAVLKQDPFWANDLADYQIMEFTPTKYLPQLAPVMESLL